MTRRKVNRSQRRYAVVTEAGIVLRTTDLARAYRSRDSYKRGGWQARLLSGTSFAHLELLIDKHFAPQEEGR